MCSLGILGCSKRSSVYQIAEHEALSSTIEPRWLKAEQPETLKLTAFPKTDEQNADPKCKTLDEEVSPFFRGTFSCFHVNAGGLGESGVDMTPCFKDPSML